jgi:hypothetical protein
MRDKVLRKALRKHRKLDARLEQLDRWARAKKLKEAKRPEIEMVTLNSTGRN